MKNEPFKLCNAIVQPGETSSLALPIPEIFNYAPMYIPIKVFHGKVSGPCVLVIAAIHGNELNGTEILHRLIKLSLTKKIKGTLIVVPVFNIYGFLSRSRQLADGLEIDQYFPGSEVGSHTARVAHLFISEVFDKANYCIDLRTGNFNYSNLPKIQTDMKNRICAELGYIFRAPILCHATPKLGSIEHYARVKNIPYLQYEAGEPLRFNEHSIRVGLKGIVNVLRYLERILPVKKISTRVPDSYLIEKIMWVRASKSGVAHIALSLGQQVKRGQLVAVIADPFSAAPSINVLAPHDGVVIAKNDLPIVHEGEALIRLAQFGSHVQTTTTLVDWHNQSTEYVKEM